MCKYCYCDVNNESWKGIEETGVGTSLLLSKTTKGAAKLNIHNPIRGTNSYQRYICLVNIWTAKGFVFNPGIFGGETSV